ncbi:Mgm101p-domain-containing protein [Aaosphaeria arxii CBS 175.79]|uniref:Mitochondrial genome maintenance protein MGM101 n=1 Tax=Aaosphaeria arxii CBS 175.79 TaxID=1450172 RepID=A0A6A5XTH1_9PLEO|nr:Mgm101p-domain-containing protein [Aaosphaeria arxii CBS 175.79]KAF2016206.1 Mgm101p-domain-containing protein [Aaosphaeria arxii CBS 175.79]
MLTAPIRRSIGLLIPSASSRAAPLAYRSQQVQARAFSASPITAAYATTQTRRAPAAATAASKSATTSSKTSSATPQRTVVATPGPASEPAPPTARNTTADAASKAAQSQRSLTDGLSDQPLSTEGVPAIDWTRSYHGLGDVAFSKEQQETLLAPLDVDDVEVKPDGILYLPEIKYRRILNKTFGPGGWGLAPRGESIVTGKLVTREYGMVVQGRLVSIARGEQQYFDPDGIPTATEGCKSNALMRCCKDLGIASELWDPRFIRKFMRESTKEVWVEHVTTKRKKKIVIRKDDVVKYPFKESKA